MNIFLFFDFLYVLFGIMQEMFLNWGREKYVLSMKNSPVSIRIREIWLVKF